MSALDDVLFASLDRAVESITIRSRWGPPVVVLDPFHQTPRGDSTGGTSDAPQAGFDLARFMKPQMIVKGRDGWEKTFSPYGDPGPSLWPLVALALGAGVTYLAVKAYRK